MSDEEGVTVRIAAVDLDWPADEVVAYVRFQARDGDVYVGGAMRPTIEQAQFEAFARWLAGRLNTFVEHGPALDGWHERADGAFECWVEQVEMDAFLADL